MADPPRAREHLPALNRSWREFPVIERMSMQGMSKLKAKAFAGCGASVRSERQRLLDALEALERIEKYAAHGRERFDQDELVQTWIIHHLEILGEALARVTAETQRLSPDIPWREITGMRNVLVHGYFGVDLDIVWTVVTDHLPGLKDSITDLLA